MSYFPYKGSQIFFEDRGTGDCLVYVHEWNGSSLPFRRLNLGHLVDHARVISFDLPGYGASGCPDDLVFDDFALILAGLMDHLAIRECTLAGFCLGSAIILDFYRKFPGRVRGMILAEPVIKFPMILIPLLVPWFGRAFLGSLSRSRLLFSIFGHRVTGGSEPASTLVFRSIWKSDPVISHRYLQLLFRKHRSEKWLPAEHDLKEVAMLVTGEKTNALFRKNAAFVKQYFNIRESRILAGAPHFVLTTQPGRVAEIFLGWMGRE